MRQIIALGLVVCLLSSSMAKKHFISDDEDDSHPAFKKGTLDYLINQCTTDRHYKMTLHILDSRKSKTILWEPKSCKPSLCN